MVEWLKLIYVGPQQAVPVVVALVLWVALAGLGALVTPRGRSAEANSFVGWALVSTVFTLVGVVVPRPFYVLAILAAVGAIAGIILAWRRNESLFPSGAWRVVVLALPFLLIAGAMAPSQWDEFSHWLPAPTYLTIYDGFPTAARPYAGPPMLPAYPYGWPLLIYLSARIAGGFLDNVGGILNMLMLLNLAGFAVRVAFAATGKPRSETMSWPLASGIVLTATLFNPTFVQKIVLTSYSDVSSSVVTGVALLLGYRLLARLADSDPRAATTEAWGFALVLALLMNIRQTNAVVAVIIVAALGLVALRDPRIVLTRFVRISAAAAVPAALVYLGWRWYVTIQFADISGAEASLMPTAMWNVDAIPKILAAMGVVAVKKFAFFLPMLVASVFAMRALVRMRSDFDRIALLTAAVFIGYNAFLLFIYVAHFQRPNALSVVSYWRYNIDVGAVAIIFIAVGALVYWGRHSSFDTYPKWLRVGAIALVVGLPIALANKIRFDLEPPKPYFTAVAKDMRAMGIAGTHYVLDPTGTGESAVITRVYLNAPGKSWMSAFQNPTPEAIATYVQQVKPGEYLLVHSVAPGASEALGRPLDSRHSYLLKRTDSGWDLIKTWTKPAGYPW